MEDIYIEPPAAGGETDEDSADEDNTYGGKMHHLSRSQLQAGAEAVLRSGNRIGGKNDDDKHPGNEKASDRHLLPKKKTRKTYI